MARTPSSRALRSTTNSSNHLVHRSDVYPKARKTRMLLFYRGWKPGAVDATPRNTQSPNGGLKTNRTSTPESSLCLRTTKELERVGGERKAGARYTGTEEGE